MKVWILGVLDCETNNVESICLTKEIAERELFKVRDELIEEWKKEEAFNIESSIKICKEHNFEYIEDDMYKIMIKNISGDDYKNWVNYPHDTPYIREMEVTER